MIDIKQLTQKKEELKTLWDYLAFEVPFPDKEIRRWLLEHGSDQIQAAIELLAKREHDVTDPIKYLGKVLHNSKLQNMTVEERQEKISALSAMAGRARAAKEHQEKVAAIRQEFAEICKDSAATPLYSTPIPLPVRSGLSTSALGVGVGFGSGLDVDPVLGTGRDTDTETEPPTAAAASRLCSPAGKEEKKEQTKPETKTNPVGVSGSSAKTTPTPKTKTCKNCGAVLERSKSHTCPMVKTQDEWVASAQGGYFQGDAGCQGCGKVRRNHNSDWCQVCWDKRQKAKAASASMNLGNVDGL